MTSGTEPTPGLPDGRCNVCCGDGWIADDTALLPCELTDEEHARFCDRMGNRSGRMKCPRCQPFRDARERAIAYAAAVRSRKPEMQVRRITSEERSL